MKYVSSVMALFIAILILASTAICYADISADIEKAEGLAMNGSDAAGAAFESILTNNPQLATERPEDFAKVQLGLASYYQQKGKYNEAIETAQKGIEVNSQDESILIELKSRLAYNYRMAKEYTVSNIVLQGLIKDYPKYAVYAWQMEIVENYEDQEQNEAALAELDKIANAYPEKREYALYAKAKLLVQQMQDYSQGVDVTKLFLTDYPDSCYIDEVKKMITSALTKLGRQKEINTLLSAVNTRVKETEFKSIEDMLYLKNKPAQAREACKKLREQSLCSSDACRVAFLEANCLYLEGKWKAAKEAFQSLYERYPVGKYHPQTKYYIANCSLHLGDQEAARTAFREEIEFFYNTQWAELAISRLSALK